MQGVFCCLRSFSFLPFLSTFFYNNAPLLAVFSFYNNVAVMVSYFFCL